MGRTQKQRLETRSFRWAAPRHLGVFVCRAPNCEPRARNSRDRGLKSRGQLHNVSPSRKSFTAGSTASLFSPCTCSEPSADAGELLPVHVSSVLFRPTPILLQHLFVLDVLFYVAISHAFDANH